MASAGFPHFPSRPDPIRWWGRLAPERIAVVDRARGGRHGYAELDRMADAWRDVLAARGVGRGDRVATLATNRVAQVALLFAAHRLGAALVPLNWRLSSVELARIVDNARAHVIVGDARFRPLLAAAAHGEETTIDAVWLELDPDDELPPRHLTRRAGLADADAVVDADDAALILYTSGSTGAPKGAVLPHRQLLYNAVATTTAWELGSGDVAPVSTPFFHTGGWNVFALPLWHVGGRVVLFDQFDPERYLDGLAEEGCTVALTVPTQLIMMLECPTWGRPIPSLRFFISGGAPCPQSVMDRVRSAGFRMKEGFGLTECGPNCFAISFDEALRRTGSVGWPVPYLEMRLTRDDGREAAVGEAGELCLRGPQMFAGYFGDPARTREAVDADGWLHTGDLARRDADGAFYICGRRKEMFISGGENVYPGEVEAALMEHPSIAEVAVIGVPDPRWGEVGCAFVAGRAGCEAVPDEILAFARTRLAGYKVPKALVFVPTLPKLGSGKVDRAALLAAHRALAVAE